MPIESYSAVFLSLQIAFFAVTMGLPFAIAIAYLLARKNFMGKSILQGIVDLPLVLPPVVTGFLLLRLFSPQSILGRSLELLGIQVAFGWLGAAVAAAVVSFPLMVRSFRASFQSIDPRLALTARSLGASPIRSFVTISLPLARHGIVAGCLLAFARSLGEFGATIMLAGNIPGQTQTIPLAIYSQSQRIGGLERSWLLVFMSIAISLIAVATSEWLEQRRSSDELL